MSQILQQTATATRAAQPQFHRYLTLTTFRQNGNAVPTIVWFAAQNGKLYVRTSAQSGKVRRIRHDRRVLIAPASASGHGRGLTVVGQARVLPQLESRAAEQALDRKYGLFAGVIRLMEDMGNLNDLIVLEITPDPGPGTETLVLEHLPDAQRLREVATNLAVAVGFAAIISGLFGLIRRITRGKE